MSSKHRQQHGQNQSHYGDWISDENGLEWYVCSTQEQETNKTTRSKLTLLVPEDGCGGDDAQEGFLMKGLGTPQAPRPSLAQQNFYSNSSQLSTHREMHTTESWEKHIEMILECVTNGSLNQENLTEEEFKAAYKFATGR